MEETDIFEKMIREQALCPENAVQELPWVQAPSDLAHILALKVLGPPHPGLEERVLGALTEGEVAAAVD